MKYIFTFLFILAGFVSFAQNEDEKIVENGADIDLSPNKKYEIPDFLKSVEPYGTFEYALAASQHDMNIAEIVPRMGLKGKWYFDESDKYYFFTTAEVGLHLSRRNDFIAISADPGGNYTKAETALYARLGFVGVSTPYGNISIGKQWGIHYNLAGNIDNMYMFGADAIGVYNAGTDGGPSGTGRADQLLKYEITLNNLWLGLQGQFRNFSSNSVYFADSYGVAAMYDFKVVKVGVSYNKVLDGVMDPSHGEAKIDDEFVAVLIDFKRENFHFGILADAFNNHEKTDTSAFFNGWGIEYNLKFNFGKKKEWSFVNNSSILMPFADEDMDYVSNRYSFEIARRFSQNVVMFTGIRIDNSTLTDGTKSNFHNYAVGFYYNFNYPVP
jgi:predicted porin